MSSRFFNALLITISLIVMLVNVLEGDTLNAIFYLGIAIFVEILDVERMLKEKE